MIKIAVVTGAGRGIGAAVCEKLSADFKDLKVVRLDKAFESLDEDCFECDVSDASSVEKVFSLIASKYGRLDVLVNNAGIALDSSVENLSEENWDKVLDVNLKGVFLCCKSAAVLMKKNRFGRIVNVASIMGEMGNRGQVNYAASKAGVIGLTKSLARELAFFGITCNAVSPGFIDTDMTRKVPENILKQFVDRIPLRRLGLPKEVASVIAFLASEEAGYVNGQVIRVDGGYL